jgi:MFS family permease
MADVAGLSSASPQVDRSLDAFNFCLADVRDGLGPYLAVYLLTVRHWNEAEIGLIMTIAGLAALLAQTPAGALIDATRAKRAIIVIAALVVTTGSLLLPFLSSFWPVTVSQAVVHATGSVFAPAIAAITLGIVGHVHFARRTGRNEAFNHAGNAFAAAAAGGAAYVWGPVVVFFLMAAMAIASLISALMVPARAINHEQARGFRDGSIATGNQPSGLRILVTCRPLLIFAACAVLFHLANAAMLPLVGQKLALQDKNLGTSLMSACIVAAQIVMVPMAMLVARKADQWGRKSLFLAGFLILPIRGVLYTFSDNPFWLVRVQMLDGIGAGLFGALFPLIVSDLMEGTGRFNVAQGAVTTAQGVGASLSTTLAGLIVVKAGYSVAFLVLAAVAGAGLVLFWWMMPETLSAKSGPADDKAAISAKVVPSGTG